ncbi:hypothetical protein ACFSYH_02010 [Populibacterium corticicola]|uniref:Uncharacterized protein n=1 Tax=Populibacterium corticicola TaxID=1812826 RepID=A0ABW5XA78_9MICO
MSAEKFNRLKDRLIAATGSPGLTSYHDNAVHMTLGEWERLITRIEELEATIQRVQHLHKPAPPYLLNVPAVCAECSDDEHEVPYPCPPIQALGYPS